MDETGKVTCNAKGKATISALVDGKVQATVTVSVTTLVESLTIGSKTGSFTLASGKKLNLTAAVAPLRLPTRQSSGRLPKAANTPRFPAPVWLPPIRT